MRYVHINCSINILIGVHSPFTIAMQPPVQCTIGLVDCNTYIKQLSASDDMTNYNVSTTLRYVVENTGNMCVNIELAKIVLGTEVERVLSLEESIKTKSFCPSDTVAFTEERYLDSDTFGSGRTLNVELTIIVSGPNKIASTTASLSLPSLPVSTPKPKAPTMAPGVCAPSPSKVTLMFQPRTCDESNNSQFGRNTRALKRTKSPASKGAPTLPPAGEINNSGGGCVDFARNPVSNPSRVFITTMSGSETFFDGTLKGNEVFDITRDAIASKFGFVKVSIYNRKRKGRKSQSIVIDLSSCPKALSYGEIFGSIKLVSFENQSI